MLPPAADATPTRAQMRPRFPSGSPSCRCSGQEFIGVANLAFCRLRNSGRVWSEKYRKGGNLMHVQHLQKPFTSTNFPNMSPSTNPAPSRSSRRLHVLAGTVIVIPSHAHGAIR